MIKRLPKEKNFVERENEAPIGVPVIVRAGGPREVKMPSYGMLLKLYTRN